MKNDIIHFEASIKEKNLGIRTNNVGASLGRALPWHMRPVGPGLQTQ